MTIGNRPATVRADGRGPSDLRPISFALGVQKWAEGSCRVRVGDTEVLCAATIADRVPPHLRGKGTGWVTAEYSMLPRATAERTDRESVRGKIGGRTHEIQRLIGRSLRGVVDLSRLGERTITVDCDVLQADGGTRTASITGGYVALAAALITYGMERHLVAKVAAVSVGIVDGLPYLDLDYSEDSRAEVDFNVVGTDGGAYVELQGTAEGKPFDRARRTACSTWPTAAWPACSRPRPPSSPPSSGDRPPPRRRHPLGPQAARAARAARSRPHEPRLARRPRHRGRSGRGRGHVRDERRDQGPLRGPGRRACRRSPTIRGSRSTPWAARQASGRGATPARTPPTPRTTPSCSTRCAGCLPRTAARATSACSPWHSPRPRARAAASGW